MKHRQWLIGIRLRTVWKKVFFRRRQRMRFFRIRRENVWDQEALHFRFYEVDAGVGGKAAVELGHRLARLAESAQVIVVTHLPQVASWADKQFVVAKTQQTESGMTESIVTEVTGEARTGEIARMLSGNATETSLEHARELLAESTL